jgi:N utilization substance protein A
VTPKNFGRIAAQTAKQVVMQRLREAERNHIVDEYSQYQDELITGIVERRDNRFVYVKIGNVEAIMPRGDQMPNEHYRPQDQIRVLVTKVGSDSKGAQIVVSRTAPDLVKRLFEEEVPEVYNGTVEIVSIAREAGDRTKIAVRSSNPDIDPVGTCVGPRGARVQNIVNELGGENIDVVRYEEDPSDFIANALNPAEVIAVQFSEDEDQQKDALVIVPDYQLSLAIGKKGQNVRLAARLTGYKIDIRPESEVEFVDEDNGEAAEPADSDKADNADSAETESEPDNNEE